MRTRKSRIQIMLLFALALFLFSPGDLKTQPNKEKQTAMEPRISIITLCVTDFERSFRFYKEGLGFPTKMTPEGGIVFFATSGTRFVLYPYEKLAEDVGLQISTDEKDKAIFPGITLGHVTREKDEVDRILVLAEKAGGKIMKKAQDVFWGGYSGYFADPDGYLWEVAYSDLWKFNPDGSIVIEE